MYKPKAYMYQQQFTVFKIREREKKRRLNLKIPTLICHRHLGRAVGVRKQNEKYTKEKLNCTTTVLLKELLSLKYQ